jgi:dethiobiotin synthetase
VRAFKPAVTGLQEPPETWPADHELLGAAAAMEPEAVSPYRFGPAVSPHLAAELAGVSVEPDVMLRRAREGAPGQTLIAEGVGGLMVPLTPTYTVCDLARALGMPLLLAARPGLGTINHTLLSLAAARAAGLSVAAVVLTPWPREPGAMEASNRDTIERMGEVEVAALQTIGGPSPAELADAGDRLPWRRWLELAA